MNEAMPGSMTFPMSQLYNKLKEWESEVGVTTRESLFIETVERTNDTDWIYGCKQHENILIVLMTGNSRTTVYEVVSRAWLKVLCR